MRSLMMKAGLVLLSLLVLSGCDKPAPLIFVDAAAHSSGDGSARYPFRDIQAAMNVANPGDTVIVEPGSYGAFQSVRHGLEGARITVVAAQPRQVFVSGAGRALDISHRFHTFRGLVFDGEYGPLQVVRATASDGLEMLDVEVHRGTPNCVVLSNVSGVLIADSNIHHCINHFDPAKNADSHGVTGTSVFDLTIRNTEIYLVSGDALQLSPPRMAWDRVRVEGGRFWSGPLDEAVNGWPAGKPIGENAIDTKVDPAVLNGKGAAPRLEVVDTIAYGWRGAIANQAAYNIKERIDAYFDRVTVYDSELAFRLREPAVVHVQNAVIYDVKHAFRLEGRLQSPEIFNATFGRGITGSPFKLVEGPPRNLRLENLLFLSYSLPAVAADSRSSMAVTSSSFFDAESHDYRLVYDSAAVDKGTPLQVVGTDRDGLHRPQGLAPDIGAYEATVAPRLP